MLTTCLLAHYYCCKAAYLLARCYWQVSESADSNTTTALRAEVAQLRNQLEMAAGGGKIQSEINNVREVLDQMLVLTASRLGQPVE